MTPGSPLRWRLREATADAHARLDARVAPAFDDVDGYTAFLRGMSRFVEAAAAATGDASFATARAALAEDLEDLGLRTLDAPVVTRIDAAAATGWRYVAAGSSLGARLLLPKARALGFDAGFGAHYLSDQAAGTHWRDFLATLDPAHSASDADAAVDGALAAFACAEHAMIAAFEPVAA